MTLSMHISRVQCTCKCSIYYPAWQQLDFTFKVMSALCAKTLSHLQQLLHHSICHPLHKLNYKDHNNNVNNNIIIGLQCSLHSSYI